MPFDPSSLFDVSHLVTFLGGAALGTTGKYLADRFTDQRRAQEAASENKKRFAKLNEVMPTLLKEMAGDLSGDKSSAIREFVILANERVMFNSSVPRFAYFESKHRHVRNQAALLAEAGYVHCGHPDTASIVLPYFQPWRCLAVSVPRRKKSNFQPQNANSPLFHQVSIGPSVTEQVIYDVISHRFILIT